MKVVQYVATSATASTNMKEQDLNVVYEVSEVPSGSSGAMTLAALSAVDSTDPSIIVPLVGQLVTISGIEFYVKSSRLSSRGNSTFFVVVTLARTFISGVGNVLVEYDTSIKSASSTHDINGQSIKVTLATASLLSTAAAKPGPVPAGTVDSATVNVAAPVGQLKVTISAASPTGLTASLPITGSVNSAVWLGAAIGTIRYDGLRASTRENAQWLVEFNFSQDHNGWNQIAWFDDPATGKPDPANDYASIIPAVQPTQTQSTGLGATSVPVNQYLDFNTELAGLTTILTNFGFTFA